jgi:DNA modification methylase
VNTPVFDRDGIRLYHGDCREIIPSLDRSEIGAILTDPPYGINTCNRSDGGVGSVSSGSKVYGRQKWDSAPPAQADFDLLLSFDVPTIIWGGNHFGLRASPCWLVWDKKQRDFTFSDAELAWTNLEKAVRIFDYSRRELTVEGRVHPTQKPLPLMLWCLSFLPPDALVIDPYAGSGTTGVACMKSGRRCILIESNPRYIPAIEARCRAAETPLFAGGAV